jgi:hypothetical protein
MLELAQTFDVPLVFTALAVLTEANFLKDKGRKET